MLPFIRHVIGITLVSGATIGAVFLGCAYGLELSKQLVTECEDSVSNVCVAQKAIVIGMKQNVSFNKAYMYETMKKDLGRYPEKKFMNAISTAKKNIEKASNDWQLINHMCKVTVHNYLDLLADTNQKEKLGEQAKKDYEIKVCGQDIK